MNTIHDMGGMHGFGPINPEENEPVFHEEWEGRVYGLIFNTGQWGQGRDWPGFRFALEALPPEDYLRMSYYERWYWALVENRLVNSDLVTVEEIEAGEADASRPRPQILSATSEPLGSGLLDIDIEAAFDIGDTIRVKEANPIGHTRVPRYTRDKTGIIHSVNGVYALQDTDAQGQLLGNYPQQVYTVKFTARELWGEQGHANDLVYVDFWESYLEQS